MKLQLSAGKSKAKIGKKLSRPRGELATTKALIKLHYMRWEKQNGLSPVSVWRNP